MVTEDYVSFEVAKLLKERGFNEATHGFYHNDYNGMLLVSNSSNHNGSINSVAAPTLQMAMKWLREVHKIHITVYPYGEHSCDNYQFDIYKNREYLLSRDEGYITNEQAIEVAIKYALENLI